MGWQKEEVHQGTVMGRLSNNTYSVRVDGKDVIVQSPYSLPTGGKVTEDWVAGVLKGAWPKLQATFGEMGYHLNTCFWKVGSLSERW